LQPSPVSTEPARASGTVPSLGSYRWIAAGDVNAFFGLILDNVVNLAILAGIETEDLVRAIATSDVARLRQVKGVGGKIAERLALELREKILTVGAGMGAKAGKGKAGAAAPAPASAAPVGPLGEVFGALVLLGYKPAEVEPLLEKLDENKPFDVNVRMALAALRKG